MKNLNLEYPLWNLDKFYYRWDKNTLRIGTDDTGSWNIPDPEQKWEYLISLCTGEYPINEIVKKMISKFIINADEIVDALYKLENTGSLTFLKHPFVMDEWTQRYKSNIAYFTNKDMNGIEVQKKLNKLKVTILGLGGGGFTVMSNLISLGIENIHVVDFDIVELSNINRQIIFKEEDIGKYKVDVGIDYAKGQKSDINISKSTNKITSVSDVENEIESSDWVFCCMDEPAYISQRLVNKACYKLKKPLVFGFCQKENGRTFIVNPSESGCVDCLFSEISDDHFIHLVSSLRKSEFKPVTSATSVTINLLCDLMIKNWLDKVVFEKNVENTIFRLDFSNFQLTEVISFKKQSNCPTCGEYPADVSRVFEAIPLAN